MDNINRIYKECDTMADTTKLILQREVERWEHMRDDLQGSLAIIENIIESLNKEIKGEKDENN